MAIVRLWIDRKQADQFAFLILDMLKLTNQQVNRLMQLRLCHLLYRLDDDQEEAVLRWIWEKFAEELPPSAYGKWTFLELYQLRNLLYTMPVSRCRQESSTCWTVIAHKGQAALDMSGRALK